MNREAAVAALRRRELVPAIVALRGHLSWSPDDGEAWMYLGIAYTEAGCHSAAIEALSEAEERIGERAELAEAFGCAYLRTGQVSIARACFERAQRLPGCPASVYRNLGVLLLKCGELATAAETVATGIERAPQDTMMLFTKVLVLDAIRRRTGSHQAACEMEFLLEEILERREVPPALEVAARAQRAALTLERACRG